MILRIALLGVIGAGLLGFGGVAWLSMRPHDTAVAAPRPVNVSALVAARDVRAGSLLRAEDFDSRTVPSVELPSGALTDTPASRRELIGGMARRALGSGDVLRPEDVLRPGDHGFLAAVLKPGMRAATVGVDAVTGTAGLIWPGDRVDVILTQSLDGEQLAPGQRIAAETVLQNALVIAIDQLLVQGVAPDGPSPTSPRTVTLEVTSREAESVQVAERIGRLSLAVRAANAGPDAAASTRQQSPVWSGDVSQAFNRRPQANAAPVVMHVFLGTSEGKEFKY